MTLLETSDEVKSLPYGSNLFFAFYCHGFIPPYSVFVCARKVVLNFLVSTNMIFLPTESIRLFYTSVSLLLSRTQGYCYWERVGRFGRMALKHV